jgi:hypothetical protein
MGYRKTISGHIGRKTLSLSACGNAHHFLKPAAGMLGMGMNQARFWGLFGGYFLFWGEANRIDRNTIKNLVVKNLPLAHWAGEPASIQSFALM